MTTFTYDALGRRTSMTHGNGVVTTYTYDAASQLLSLAHKLGATTINSSTYSYDKVGNRKTKADNDGTANYTYDTLNRLVQAVNPLPSNPLESFTYDPVGNRTDSNQNGLSQFNSANEISEDGDFTYQYDNNGNMTRKTAKAGGAVTTYEYDVENKLVRVVSSGTTVDYKYDGLGRRAEKSVIGAATTVRRFIYDNEDILLELDGANNITARYTHGPGIDEPLVMEKGGASFFYHADGLGSITEITDAAGTLKQQYTYSSFGKIESQLDPSFVQPYTFTAREFDPETDTYFYRYRTYDWRTGRFGQEDPVRFLAGDNFYTYVNNNPINFADPSGLQQEESSQCPPKRNCLKEFFNCLADCFIAPGISTVASQGGEAAGVYYTGRAWQHAAARGLNTPLRSSIFRPLLRLGNILGPIGTLGALVGCETYCLWREAQCERLL